VIRDRKIEREREREREREQKTAEVKAYLCHAHDRQAIAATHKLGAMLCQPGRQRVAAFYNSRLGAWLASQQKVEENTQTYVLTRAAAYTSNARTYLQTRLEQRGLPGKQNGAACVSPGVAGNKHVDGTQRITRVVAEDRCCVNMTTFRGKSDRAMRDLKALPSFPKNETNDQQRTPLSDTHTHAHTHHATQQNRTHVSAIAVAHARTSAGGSASCAARENSSCHSLV
jgi:hypothetical protein